jgi:hypothetical protein
MMKERLPIVLSTVALVVAVLGATPAGEAARDLVIPRGSVGTPQLKKGAVTAPKLAKGAVTSLKVRNGSLLAEDFKAGQLPAGAKGDKGDKGDPGPPGVSAHQIVVADSATNSTDHKLVSASCPAGKRVIGGGAATDPGYAVLWRSYPVFTNSQRWSAGASELAATANNWTLTVYAICANVQ